MWLCSLSFKQATWSYTKGTQNFFAVLILKIAEDNGRNVMGYSKIGNMCSLFIHEKEIWNESNFQPLVLQFSS